MSTPAARIKDIPALERDASNIKAWADAMGEAMQTLLGFRGDGLDKALTARSAREVGLLDQYGNPLGGSGSTTIIIGGGGGGGAYTPDLTPPPAPTGLTLTPGFANLFIEWTAPVYTQGHGHKKTNIYGVKFATGAGGTVTFSSAVRIGEAWDARTLYAHPTELGTNWAIWITFETVDGVEGSPAGGANGAQATIGKVGTSDLGSAIVLAGNLAPGSVTADKAALDIGGDNLLANNSFEVDQNGDSIADGWAAYNNTPGTEPSVLTRTTGRISGFAQRNTWTGTNTSTKGVVASASVGGGVRGGWQPGKTYIVSFYAKSNSLKAAGCGIYWNVAPSAQTALKNPNLDVGWQRYAFRITWGGSVEGNGALFLSVVNTAAVTGWIEFDDVQVEEGDFLSGYQGKLALNTIVAGDGAIANLAITNALIGAAAVDDAKVANLSAAKLTAGSGVIGGPLMSSNYVAGVSGWVVMPNGFAEFGFASIRGVLLAGQIGASTITTDKLVGGAVMGGAYTGYAWPAAGAGGGFYLGPSGLLLGSYNDGKYLQVSAAGDIYAPGFSIINGNATFSGTLAANIVTANSIVVGAVSGQTSAQVTGPVSVTAQSHTPDGFTWQTTIASKTFTPDASLGAVNVSVTVTVTAAYALSASGVTGYLDASIQDAAGYDGFNRTPVAKIAAGSSTQGTFSTSRTFTAVANASVEYRLVACVLNPSDVADFQRIDMQIKVNKK